MSSFDLFPVPSVSPSGPHVLPGIDAQSTTALREVLKENHERNHIYFHERGLHNHITHHMLALWALGAPASIIKAAYKEDTPRQKPARASPEKITVDNYSDHLGDAQYFSAYMAFFKEVIEKKGIDPAIEEYVFSAKANVDKEGKHPGMLSRFLGGLIHPMIHTGYGLEFKLPGMVVEGLAETAVTKANLTPLVQLSLFESSAAEKLTSQVQNGFSLNGKDAKGVHALTILARLSKDEKFSASISGKVMERYTSIVDNHGPLICSYVNQWCGTAESFETGKKVEELQWLMTLMYAIAGWQTADPEFNADFLVMHLVTSSLFLSSFVARLSPHSQYLLLRSYFAASLVYWLVQGRPELDLEGFFASPVPAPPSPSTPRPKWSLLFDSTEDNTNRWLSIIHNTISHPDDHLPKIQRAFAEYARLYGDRAAGYWTDDETELKGASKLDGSLFVRAAALTDSRLYREAVMTHDMIIPQVWDRRGYRPNGEGLY